jgi:hypothetical protein
MDFDTGDAVNPDMPGLLQEDEAAVPAVDVRPVGPIRTHVLPARVAHSRNISVTEDPNPAMLEIIASEDLRRQYLAVIVSGQPVIIGHDRHQVAEGVAGILPVGIMLYLHTAAPVFVRSATAGTAIVSYWTGQWAD